MKISNLSAGTLVTLAKASPMLTKAGLSQKLISALNDTAWLINWPANETNVYRPTTEPSLIGTFILAVRERNERLYTTRNEGDDLLRIELPVSGKAGDEPEQCIYIAGQGRLITRLRDAPDLPWQYFVNFSHPENVNHEEVSRDLDVEPFELLDMNIVVSPRN